MKILESEQQDFIISLIGKKIRDIPMETESECCQKVRDGERCVEYEMYYYAFDSGSSYMDGWKP